MMPPNDYFREGFRRFITHCSGYFDENGRELQFILKIFRLESKRTTGLSRGDKGEIISTIEVEVLLKTEKQLNRVDIYDRVSWNQVENVRDGISSGVIQYVLDLNFYKLLKDILTDQKFLEAIK